MDLVIESEGEYGKVYLGNIVAASDINNLKKYNIQAVLTVAARSGLSYEQNAVPFHKIFPVDDIET